METNQSNTQHFYPKYLDIDEINDPLLVIRDFFSADWLPGHLEKLREWRKYVIEEDYFQDHTSSPASLLFTHKLNTQLVEATYLLSRTKKAKKLAKNIHINFEEQLQQEESEWIHYPVYLSSVERINPYLAIRNFFNAYSIDQYRDFLYEWLETGLSSNAIDETLEVRNIICFYENMQKLYGAAWIIRQREMEAILKKNFDQKKEATESVKLETKGLALIKVNCTFNDYLTLEEKFGLNELVKLILAEIPSVQLIIHLGTHPKPDTYYLLIIVDENEKRAEREIVGKIEDKCKPLINVYAIVHKGDAFVKALEDGNRFFTNALINNRIYYQSADIELLPIKPIDEQVIKATMESNWKRWGLQGKQFLEAALHCFDEGNYNVVVFLLHQSAESVLNAIIRVNLGYRLAVHNLSRMLGLTLLFTDDLRDVFDLTAMEEVQLFTLLQTAYSAARYKENFNPDSESLKALSDKACKLFIITEALYEQVFNSFKD